MTWVKLDDRFPMHPKVVGISDRAFRYHVIGLCYCAGALTDGRVPFGVVPGGRYVAELITAGLWELDQDGDAWFIHDYLLYNPTRAHVEQERGKKQAAGQAGGLARAKARAQAQSKPVPVPGPVPESINGEAKTAARSTDNNPNQPSDRQLYFDQDLALGIPAIVKLNIKYGRPAVLSAMEQIHGFPPEGGVDDAYAYVASVASFKAAAS